VADESEGAAGWHVIVPIKSPDRAKTRLDVAPQLRRRLALSMAVDTLDAIAGAAAVAKIWVVCEDADVLRHTAHRALPVVPEDPGQPAAANSVDVAVARALTLVVPTGAAHPVAVVMADLPAATTQDLDQAFSRAAGWDRSAVADADEDGTTMLFARISDQLQTRYGPASSRRHQALGYRLLDAGATIRRDVDTLDDLTVAARLGLGAQTQQVLDDALR
jgi:2-phospho-L-lactate guanylyltransferase